MCEVGLLPSVERALLFLSSELIVSLVCELACGFKVSLKFPSRSHSTQRRQRTASGMGGGLGV